MPNWVLMTLVLLAIAAFLGALAAAIRWGVVRLGRKRATVVVLVLLASLAATPIEIALKIAAFAGLAPLFIAAFAVPEHAIRSLKFSAMTLAAIAGGLAFAVLVPMHAGYTTRAKMSEVALALSAGRTALSEFHAQHKRLPKDAKELGRALDSESKWVRSIGYSSGELRAVVAIPEIEGKTLVLKAEPDGEGLKWTCYSTDIPPRHLPASCR